MFVNDCFLDAKLDDSGLEGFVLTVTKTMVNRIPIPKEQQKSQGPFKSIHAAQVYAHSWTEELPPPIPDPGPIDPMNPTKKDESAKEDLPPHVPPLTTPNSPTNEIEKSTAQG